MQLSKVILASVGLLTLSCSGSKIHDQFVIDQQKTPEGQPRLPSTKDAISLNVQENYDLYNKECQPSQALEQVGEFTHDVFYREEFTKISFISSLSSVDRGLHTKGISQVVHGQKDIINKTVDKDLKKEKTHSLVEVRSSKGLYLCDSDPESNSLEYQALTAVANLQPAVDFYNRSHTPLKPVKLNLFPEKKALITIENEDKPKYIFYIGDNASYNGNHSEISVFSRVRLVDKESFKPNKFWTSQFVLSHEYGHHVFHNRALNADLQNSLKLKSEPIVRNPPLSEIFGTRKKKKRGLTQKVSSLDEGLHDRIQLVIRSVSALNEGFADLFSYLVNGQKPELSFGLTGLEKTRDVESPIFADGQDKQLTRDVLRLFFAKETDSAFNDVHTIGAIFAHGLHELVQDRDDEDEILYRWLDLLRDRFVTALSARGGSLRDAPADYLFKAALVDFIDAMAPSKLKNEVSSSQCRVLETVFPILEAHDDFIRIFVPNLLDRRFDCI